MTAEIVHYAPGSSALPQFIEQFVQRERYEVVTVLDAQALVDRLNRSYPVAVVLEGEGSGLALCRRIKGDGFLSVVPVLVYTQDRVGQAAPAALEAGADEVLSGAASLRERELRLELALRRAERDTNVNPSTRLPGVGQIERDLATRLAAGETFAVAYTDLDHFKEFNDRYGYPSGNRVITITSRILRDVVRGYAGEKGFVGHIGGDDFIFVVPAEYLDACCSDVIEAFSELAPLHYSEEDRENGWFLGQDRRGVVHQVPLLTISIGVATNRHRDFLHLQQIGDIASEMKAYAKTQPGSVYLVDRRRS